MQGLSLAKIAGELNKRKVARRAVDGGTTRQPGMCCNDLYFFVLLMENMAQPGQLAVTSNRTVGSNPNGLP